MPANNPATEPAAKVSPVASKTPPDPSNVSAIPPKPKADTGIKKLLAAIVAAVIIVAGLGFLFLSPMSPLVTPDPPHGPQLLVGKNPYIFACSVFDADVVAKELSLNKDKSKQNVEESYAFAPDNTKDKTIDLISLTKQKSIDSTCRLKLDRQTSTNTAGKPVVSFINVTVVIRQFPSDKAASDHFKSVKQQAGTAVKSLPAYSNSFYGTPTAGQQGPTYVRPQILHKNLVIGLASPIVKSDATGEKAAAQLSKVTKDLLTRIDNHEGDMPKNFSNIAKLDKNPYIDGCQTINYVKVALALGEETQFDPSRVSGTHGYAPTDDTGSTPTHVNSSCTFGFRTNVEVASQKNQKKPPSLSEQLKALGLPPSSTPEPEENYSAKFPHYFIAQIYTFADKSAAQKFMDKSRQQAHEQKAKNAEQPLTVSDVKIGDDAFKITGTLQTGGNEAPDTLGVSYDTQFYYIANGPYVYLVSTSYTRQTEPYKTTDHKLSDQEMTQIFKEFKAGSRYAQRKS